MNKRDIKTISELSYWRGRYTDEGNTFGNSHYEEWMLNLLETDSQSIFHDKIVADFGCGPRGSLAWIKDAKAKIGLDVLVPEYLANFASSLKNHNMIYVTTTESHIPLPDDYVDIMFTINSFDHVRSPRLMSKEILRVVKKGGILAGSFNLYEPPTACEPQTLKMEDIDRYFISKLKDSHVRISYKSIGSYDNILQNNLLEEVDLSKPCTVWIKGIKA